MNKLKIFANKFSIAWISCILCMVQGNLSIINLNHALIASKTGTLTGLIVVTMSYIKLNFRYKLPIFMFIGCFIGDLLIHPTHFAEFWTEAFVTALVASILTYFITLTPAGQKLEDYFK